MITTNLLKVIPKGNFYIQEFISPWWAKQARNPEHILTGLKLNNPAMIEGTQLIRDSVGESVTINDWHMGGPYTESCLRTPTPVATQRFAVFSGHMFWNCADLKFASLSTDEVYKMILEDQQEFNMVVAMEDIEATRSKAGHLGTDWLHVQFGYRLAGTKIKIIRP